MEERCCELVCINLYTAHPRALKREFCFLFFVPGLDLRRGGVTVDMLLFIVCCSVTEYCSSR